MAVRAIIDLYKKDVVLTLIRENLILTPEGRLMRLQHFCEFTEELRRAGKKLAGARSERPQNSSCIGDLSDSQIERLNLEFVHCRVLMFVVHALACFRPPQASLRLHYELAARKNRSVKVIQRQDNDRACRNQKSSGAFAG